MGSARRKTVLWLAGLSLLAVVAFAIFGRQQIVERWYIYQLDSDDAETVDDAARRLAAMGSTRAIMPLIDQIPNELAKERRILSIDSNRPVELWWTDSAVFKAIHDLGDDARAAARSDLIENISETQLLQAMQSGTQLQYTKLPPVQQLEVLMQAIVF